MNFEATFDMPERDITRMSRNAGISRRFATMW